jgi:nucleoside-diphosphate kinase
MSTERTFAIIKPDAVKARHTGRILARIEEAGFAVRAMRLVHLSKREAEGYYAVHARGRFSGSLTISCRRVPCVVMALEAPGRDSEMADPGWVPRTRPRRTPARLRKSLGSSIELPPRTAPTPGDGRRSSWATSSGAWNC